MWTTYFFIVELEVEVEMLRIAELIDLTAVAPPMINPELRLLITTRSGRTGQLGGYYCL